MAIRGPNWISLLATATIATAFVQLSPRAGYGHPVVKPIVLEGTVVTPETVIPDGKVVIQKDRIAAVGTDVTIPAGSLRIRTNGIIYPGLIDLHNHLVWNVFPIWTPPQYYNNRYEWRANDAYLTTYARWNAILHAVDCERNKYAELKALIGGVTTVEGALFGNPCIKGLLRSVDSYSGLEGPEIGKEKLLHILDVDSITPESAAEIRRRLADKEITSLILHLAEGRRGDRESQDEFTLLQTYGLITDKTALIHGTGIDTASIALMGRKRAKLIWSPRSNLTLYGETADIRSALRYKVLIALAPDWSITGSDNMLDELKVARIWYDDARDDLLQNRDLVLMVTSNPAVIAGLADKIGRVQAGYAADIVVVHGNAARPYGALVDARVENIDMVMIGGQPYYGSPSIMQALGQGSDSESLDVCGQKKMLHLRYHNVAENPLNITAAELVQRLTTAMSQVPEPKPQLAPLFTCR